MALGQLQNQVIMVVMIMMVFFQGEGRENEERIEKLGVTAMKLNRFYVWKKNGIFCPFM